MSHSTKNKKGNKWLQSIVMRGQQLGTKLGFPTLNLDNPNILRSRKKGVYTCHVRISDKMFGGVLYYGPRLIVNETHIVLEIFVFDFNTQVYDQIIEFIVLDFIRGPKNFASFDDFKKQLTRDCEIARKLLTTK